MSAPRLSPISLNDTYTLKILEQPAILAEFPGLAAIAQKKTPNSTSGCSKCRSKGNNPAQAARTLIMNMSDPQLEKLKHLLNVAGRPFVAYLTTGGKHQRQVR